MTATEAPRRRDPEATRASILDAAETLFVEKGFAATSMSDISQEAEVTKSLIHHHFGSKEELWAEVRRRKVSHYAELQTQLIAGDPGPAGVLAQSIETYFRFVMGNPEWVRLNLWMSLEDPRLSAVVRPDLVRLGVEALEREQRAGVLRSDVEPRHMITMFVSLSLHWFMAKESFRQAKLVVDDGKSADERYLQDLLKVFMEGARPR